MSAKQKSKIRILVAEDSRTQAEQLGYMLERQDYAVDIAGNGKLALQAALARKPDMILSDIVMPEMDGYELCRAVKSDETLRDIPVILVTALSDSQDVIRGLECGADNFIRKPYDERYLLSRIDYLLMNKELRKNQKLQMGMQIDLFGHKYFINSERQQILDLLISTYEQAIHINGELQQREQDLAHSNNVLNGLYRIADGLNHAVSEQGVAELALERALELPGIEAGWILMREGETRIRLAAARNLPPALATPAALEGDCQCTRKLLAGEFDAGIGVFECERLSRAKGDKRGLRFHASVPLWLGGKALGTMNLVGPEDGVFNEGELKMLHGVGHQVAVAMERARLHEQLERMVEERTAALRASEERLRTIIEAEPACVKIVDRQQGVVQMNAAGLAMIEAGNFEQVRGGNLADYVVAQQRAAYRSFEVGVQMGKSASAEFEVVGLKGTHRWLEIHAVPFPYARDNRQILAIARDITQHKLAENMLRVSEEKFRVIYEGALDGVLLADAASKRFVEGNPAICRMLGYSAGELVRLGVEDIHPTQDLPHVIKQFEKQVRGELSLAADLPLKRKDGSVFYVDIKSSVVNFGDKKYLLGIFRDITQRKASEARIARLNRIYAVLSGINTTIVRAHDEGELFGEACRIAVEHGGFVFGWIGKYDAALRRVRPVAQAGRNDGYLAQINLSVCAGVEGSCALTTQALDEMKPAVCNDIANDERMAAWRDAALKRGYRSVTVFPLVVEGKAAGVFALYATEPGVFDDDEMKLLVEMSEDISYALVYFGREAQRAQAETALKESRSLLKAVIDTSPMRIFWKDKQSRYLGCNPAFARDAGATAPEDLLGKDDYSLGWKEQAEQYRADDRQVMESGIPKLSYDEPQATPGGEIIWLRTSKVPLRDSANEIIGVLGIYEDITGRKRTELALQRSEADLKLAQFVAQIGSWHLDIASNRLVWSEQAHRIFGVPPQDAVDLETFVSTLHPDDRERVLASWGAAVAGAPYDIEHRIVAGGETRWVRERAIIERDAAGRALSGIGTTQDITERKQAEEELHKLMLAVEQSPNSIVITDLDAKLQYVNEAFVKATGYSRAEAIGQNPRILHSGKTPETTFAEMWAHLTRGEVWKGELINRRKNGSEYVESVLISPVRDSNGHATHYLGIKEDITERKLAESKLSEQFDELRRWHEATLGREMRAIELKREVNELLRQAGLPPRYASVEEDEPVASAGQKG